MSFDADVGMHNHNGMIEHKKRYRKDTERLTHENSDRNEIRALCSAGENVTPLRTEMEPRVYHRFENDMAGDKHEDEGINETNNRTRIECRTYLDYIIR